MNYYYYYLSEQSTSNTKHLKYRVLESISSIKYLSTSSIQVLF